MYYIFLILFFPCKHLCWSQLLAQWMECIIKSFTFQCIAIIVVVVLIIIIINLFFEYPSQNRTICMVAKQSHTTTDMMSYIWYIYVRRANAQTIHMRCTYRISLQSSMLHNQPLFRLLHATVEQNDCESFSFLVTLWPWVKVKVIHTGGKM